MTVMKPQQLELIDPPAPLFRTELEAPDAPRRPYYRISIYYRAGFGYLVEKASGADGARPNIEVWFRPSLHPALYKQGHLVAEKLNKKRRGRIYIIVGKESEGE